MRPPESHHTLTTCRRCPRLVAWREQVAAEKVRRFATETYWGRPVPSFGDWSARILIVGLAPAAHGANRTGRMFTGDRSGDWLYRALHKAGLANQPTSVAADDGLTLTDTRITAVCHCAPPTNKPLPEEIVHCRPYLLAELTGMPTLTTIVALGKLAFDQVLLAYGNPIKPHPAFGHNVRVTLADGKTLIGSYHPSQQNTFTGKLTEPMLDAVFENLSE